jgi:hypothetical protein
MNMVPYEFRVIGVSPLLMHNPLAMTASGEGSMKKPTKIPSPEEEAERGLYRLDNRQLYVPAIAYRNSMLNAAKGRRVKALKMSARDALSGSVFNLEDRCPLFRLDSGEPIMEPDQIDVRRAVIPSSGAAVLRARGLVNNWRCNVHFHINEDFMSLELLLEIFNLAGSIKGVLDYRPECTGSFGRFVVEHVPPEEPVKTKRNRMG